jgi:NAD-dependent dihydropyrimidine dehydrogenase PreA subunit
MKIINKTDFKASVNKLINDGSRRVVGVKNKGEKFVFGDLNSSDELRLDYDVTLYPPKKYFLPQKEILMKYDMSKGYQLKDVNEVEPLILIGVHPYDIVALQQLDKIFQDGNADQNYLKKREASIIIGVNIANVSPYSFAGSMDSAIVEEGFDLMLTDVNDSYAIEIGSNKGEQILKGFSNVADAKDDIIEKVSEFKNTIVSKFERRLNFDVEELPLMLRKNIDDEVTFQKELSNPTVILRGMLRRSIKNEMFWEEHSKKCLTCGTCIMVCPTCYCFDVKDEMDLSLKSGNKIRTWDGCMLQEFAKIATGENFRSSKSERYRHRFLRKGLYNYERYGIIACVGCGRCSSQCLPDIADPSKVFNDWKAVIS